MKRGGVARQLHLPSCRERLENSDPTTLMARMPSVSDNLPQLHWLGWTKKEELAQSNSDLEAGNALDITLRPVDENAESTSSLPLGAVWGIPNIPYRLFVSVPRSRTTDINQVEGGSVFVYRARICEGCTGMAIPTATAAGTWSFTPATALAPGAHRITVRPPASHSQPHRTAARTQSRGA